MIKKILTTLTLLAILLSIITVMGRVDHEFSNREVQYGLFNNELNWLAATKNIPRDELYKDLSKMGIDTIVYREDTILSLREIGTLMVYTGWQIIDMERFLVISDDRIRDIIGEGFNYNRTYIMTHDEELNNRIFDILNYRNQDVIQHFSNPDLTMLSIPSTDNLYDIPLGFLDIPPYAKRVIPYFMEDYERTPEEVKLVTDDLKDFGIDAVTVLKNRLPYNIESRNEFISWLIQRDLLLGIDEFSSKIDFSDFIAREPIGVYRYYLRPYHRFSEEFMISTRDRNTRLTIFRTGTDEGLLGFWESIIKDNKGFGFSPGVISPIATSPLYKYYLPFIIMGALSAILLLMERLLSIKLQVYMLVLPLGGAIAGVFNSGFIIESIAFITALTFPILAIKYMMNNESCVNNYKNGIKRFSGAIIITVIGGLFLHGILGDIAYLTGSLQFRGIKALYVAGYILLFLLLFEEERGKLLEKLSFSRYSIRDIFLMVLGLAAFFLLWNRSGNESIIPIPKIELQLRSLLESLMWVRPRTKEFLLGHPAALLLLLTGVQDRKRTLLIVAAALGQFSVINTFAHIHIPFYISMIRTLEGVALGLALTMLVFYLKKGIEGKYYNG